MPAIVPSRWAGVNSPALQVGAGSPSPSRVVRRGVAPVDISRVDTTAVAATTVSTQSGTAPTGVQVGDLLIVVTSLSIAAGTTWGESSYTGWTIAEDLTASSMLTRVLWRVADGSGTDAPPAVTTVIAAHRVTIAAAYRGVDTTAPFLTESGQTESTSQTQHDAPALSNSDGNAWAVVTGAARQVATPLSWTPGAGLTETEDIDTALANTNNCAAFWADSNGVVAAGGVTYSASTSAATARANMWAAFLRPLAVGGASPVTVSPTLASSTPAASAPTVTATLTVTPDLASSAPAVFDPILSGVPYPVTVYPPLVTAGDTWVGGQSWTGSDPWQSQPVAFAPSVSFGTAGTTVTPNLASSSASAFNPAVSLPLTVTPGLASSTAQAFTPVASPTLTVTPGLASSSASTFAPDASLPLTVTPGLASATAQAFSPAVSLGAVTATPGLASSTAAAFDPAVSGVLAVTPGVASSSAAASAPNVSLPVTASPGLASSSAAAFAPAVSLPLTVTPGVASSSATALDPVVTVVGGPLTVVPNIASSTAQGFAPTVGGSVTAQPGLASSPAQAFAPSLSPVILILPGTAVTVPGAPAPSVSLQVAVGPGRADATPSAYPPTVDNPPPASTRDITVTFGPGQSRSLTATANSRGLSAVGSGVRRIDATGVSRQLASTGASRSLTAVPEE